ncbi:MAG: hypothetical protein INR65_05665 [Gluconacetobacter diazotrophicus]|nr:hypothetical protein [Gluconacetobacter diazotrophicus]
MATDRDGQGGEAPSGPPPKGHEHSQGEGMVNGIPEAGKEGRATATPHSEREDSETAAGRADGGNGTGAGG